MYPPWPAETFKRLTSRGEPVRSPRRSSPSDAASVSGSLFGSLFAGLKYAQPLSSMLQFNFAEEARRGRVCPKRSEPGQGVLCG